MLLRPQQDASYGPTSAETQLGRGQHYARARAGLRSEAQPVAHTLDSALGPHRATECRCCIMLARAD